MENNQNNSIYETILFEREKIIRFLILPDNIDDLELDCKLYVVYKKAKAFLNYINENDIKIGDSTLIPQIDFNKNISIENALTIYNNSVAFAQNTCKYLNLDLYGAAINLLEEVFNKIVSLIESEIKVEEVEHRLIKEVKLEDISFYITNNEILIENNNLENNDQVKYIYDRRLDIYDLYKKQSDEYTILSDLEGLNIMNISYGIVNVIVKKDDINKVQFEEIVDKMSKMRDNSGV